MHHAISIERFGVRLRPVRLDDSPFIVWLRNLDHAKGNVGDSAADIEGQRAWLMSSFQCEGDYYFLIETTDNAIPVGTYSIYGVQNGQGESGRWIVRPGIPVAIPSIVLGFEVAFDWLELARLRAHTVSTNHRVLSLNRRLGFKEVRVRPAAQMIDGKAVDLIQFELSAKDWPEVRAAITPMAELAAKDIRNWEQTARPCAW